MSVKRLSENPLVYPTVLYNPETGKQNGFAEGISMRDHVAIKALAAILNQEPQFENAADQDAVKRSYRIADMMLAERQK